MRPFAGIIIPTNSRANACGKRTQRRRHVKDAVTLNMLEDLDELHAQTTK